MIPAIIGGVGAAAQIASILTRKQPQLENFALGSDGTQGAGAVASRRFAEDRVDRTGLATTIANRDIGNNAQAFEQSALAQGALANRKAQEVIGSMKRQVNETPGMSAAQRAGVNNNLTQNMSQMLQNQAMNNTQTAQQIAGMNTNASQQQLGNIRAEQQFDQSRLPQIQWQQRMTQPDNRLSDVLGAVGSLAGMAAGGGFGDLGGMLGGGSKGIRSNPQMTESMAIPPAMPISAPPPVSLLPTPAMPTMPTFGLQRLNPMMMQSNDRATNDIMNLYQFGYGR